MDKTIGIIGLGRVGFPVAKQYIDNGYTVLGYARRKEVIEAFEIIGGIHKSSPLEVAQNSNLIIVMVLNDLQVKEVILADNGLLAGLSPGSIIICMSTINRSNLLDIASECSIKGIDLVDCPFTGGPARVSNSSLTLIAAASDQIIRKITPVLNVIGKIIHVGRDIGMGQAVKYCNQLMVGATHAATMEVITLARKLKLDANLVCNVVGSGIAGSDYFTLLSNSVLLGNPSPGGLGQMCKDMSIVSNIVDEVEMAGYVAKAAARYFQIALDRNMQDEEGSSLIKIVDRIQGNDN